MKGYIAIATGCRQLQTLRMYACANVNDAVLQACGQLLPELRVLDICGAHMATDEGAKVSPGFNFLHAGLVSWLIVGLRHSFDREAAA